MGGGYGTDDVVFRLEEDFVVFYEGKVEFSDVPFAPVEFSDLGRVEGERGESQAGEESKDTK